MNAVLCLDNNNGLGKDDKLLYRIPDDLKRFKNMTMCCNIIMGRKTFESLKRPLPFRRHIVLTRDKTYTYEHKDVVIIHDKHEISSLSLIEADTYIIGGSEIYKLFEDEIELIFLTRVLDSGKDCDTFYEIPSKFKLISSSPEHDYKKIKYKYETYKKY